MINYNDNPIVIDVDSRKRNNIKLFCVLCNNEKIELTLINPEENRYRCGRCKNTYQPNFEIMPQEDILESSHSEEDEEETGLLFAAEDEFKSEDNNDTSKSDIAVPKYMQDSETNKVTYFREE